MKATGIVRRIDDLGRVVIPKEIRRTMRYAGLSQTEWLGVNLSDLIYIKKGSKVESLHLLI